MEDPSPPNVDIEPAEIVTPAITTSSALARYEFESGRRENEATKILMVEWSDENGPASIGDWEVSWEGKSLNLAARDGAEGKVHRIYFLLAPGVNVPRIVNISQKGGKSIQTNPLPALFPPELGVTALAQGRKGVLHTIWAKKRLSVLQREIELEKQNGEGVGLGLALMEKKWIEDNFGVGGMANSEYPRELSPTSPKTPGGRLAEKLKGLKLGTSASELASSSREEKTILADQPSNPLSPDAGDVAVSSFSLFHAGASQSDRLRDPPVVKPTDYRQTSRLNSLDAIAAGHIPPRNNTETEDGLFAVQMSPRSPEMTKSPFSFSARDTPWLRDTK